MDELKKARRELAKTVDSFVSTINDKIKDSENVARETIFVSETSIATLAHGEKDNQTRVNPNEFNATLVSLQGTAVINLDNGQKKKITESNRCVFIPKNNGFNVTVTGKKNSILTIIDKHEVL